MTNGQTFQTEVIDASGSVEAPLSSKQMLSKALSCCAAYPADAMKALVESVLNLETCSALPDISCFDPTNA